jgi:hypothetical protein
MSAEYSSVLKIDVFTFRQRVLDRLDGHSDITSLPSSEHQRIRGIVESAFSDTKNFLLAQEMCDSFKLEALEALESPQICVIVGNIFDDVFAKTKRSAQKDTTVLHGLYRDLLKHHAPKEEMFRKASYESWFKNKGFDWEDLNFECEPEGVRAKYEQFRVIQLRPIDPTATTLMIGCGNGRLSDQGGYPAYDEPYSLGHNHPLSVVTLDIDLGANPTIVAPFGVYSVADVFGSQKFETIIFEGTLGYSQAGPYKFSLVGAQDACRLLAPHGKIYVTDDESQEDITQRVKKQVAQLREPKPSADRVQKRKEAPELSDLDDDDEKEQGAKKVEPGSKRAKTTHGELPPGNDS